MQRSLWILCWLVWPWLWVAVLRWRFFWLGWSARGELHVTTARVSIILIHIVTFECWWADFVESMCVVWLIVRDLQHVRDGSCETRQRSGQVRENLCFLSKSYVVIFLYWFSFQIADNSPWFILIWLMKCMRFTCNYNENMHTMTIQWFFTIIGLIYILFYNKIRICTKSENYVFLFEMSVHRKMNFQLSGIINEYFNIFCKILHFTGPGKFDHDTK